MNDFGGAFRMLEKEYELLSTEDLIDVFLEITTTVKNEDHFWFQIMLAIYRKDQTIIEISELRELVMKVDQRNLDISDQEQSDYASVPIELRWTVDDATCG